MKPLAISFKLVIDDQKRLRLETETIFDDGSTVFRQSELNQPVVLHIEDLIAEAKEKKT